MFGEEITVLPFHEEVSGNGKRIEIVTRRRLVNILAGWLFTESPPENDNTLSFADKKKWPLEDSFPGD